MSDFLVSGLLYFVTAFLMAFGLLFVALLAYLWCTNHE